MNYFWLLKNYQRLPLLFIFSLGCFLQCTEKTPVCLDPLPLDSIIIKDDDQENLNSENCNNIYIFNKKQISDIKDAEFAEFYVDYLLQIYCIKITQNIDDSNSTDKQKEELKLRKFGDNFFERSKKEAKKIFTMEAAENYGELDSKLLEVYKARRME